MNEIEQRVALHTERLFKVLERFKPTQESDIDFFLSIFDTKRTVEERRAFIAAFRRQMLQMSADEALRLMDGGELADLLETLGRQRDACLQRAAEIDKDLAALRPSP